MTWSLFPHLGSSGNSYIGYDVLGQAQYWDRVGASTEKDSNGSTGIGIFLGISTIKPVYSGLERSWRKVAVRGGMHNEDVPLRSNVIPISVAAQFY